ncbi:GNAT family N-acetyltransferase [Roseovarius sp. ZX-A-9]|uniref:GNAT family N-acetyltransferase n=1 Tax=Roseovarius sp. ZX-A-9 TaxID=3014783 RepID=UPI00232DE742|nr:GNAT family N-acetyltransferase [Roseovarius sp. ZX-A-9]
MTKVHFRIAERRDAGQLNIALAALSADIGDEHRATGADLVEAGWGGQPVFRAQLAEAEGALVGAVLYSPVYSTARGCVVVYVADLWIAATQRGSGLGRKMLREVMRDAAQMWNARWMKLTVYDTSPAARRFYDRLGFQPAHGSTEMYLDEAGCAALGGDA